MKLVPTKISGVYVVEAEPVRDERGYFARTFDEEMFARRGVPMAIRQCGTSFNARRGTLRGLHYQAEPAAETKLVRCSRGAIFDVAVDLRPSSPSFRQWIGLELSAENAAALLIPRDCAHGFLTLADATEVLYQIDTPYVPELSRGVRWNDPAFAIAWPFAPAVIAPRDARYPDFVA
jgi:dTDP-4-dehydrorhamnose 3,5-epimerase